MGDLRRPWIVLGLAMLWAGPVQTAEPLPGTQPLTETGDLAAKMVQGIHTYLDREIAASVAKRQALWKPDFRTPEAYRKSLQPNRERLRKMLGIVDERVPPRMEFLNGPGYSSVVANTEDYWIDEVRWSVLPGVDGEGLLITQKAGTPTRGTVIAIPDADQTPEQIAGLVPGVEPKAQFARRLASHGFRVLIPTLIDRGHTGSANARLGRATNQPHREFVHRMAYEMGRTLPGYEVQKILAAVDVFAKEPLPKPVGVFGYGAGGRVALFATALDDRISSVVVSGAFGPREGVAAEPIDENLWGLLTEFGDGDLLRLIVPRHAIIEASAFSVANPKPLPGLGNAAAPGRYEAHGMAEIQAEMGRVLNPLLAEWKHPRERIQLTSGVTLSGEIGKAEAPAAFRGPGFDNTYKSFLRKLAGQDIEVAKEDEPPVVVRKAFDPAARQKRQFDQLIAFTQKLWRDSEPVRKARFAKADASSPEAWDKSVEPLREFFHTEVIGKLPDATVPLNPRSRPVYNEPTWTGHEVMLDVAPDIFAYGILLLPKGLKPGEKRPVIVCQHGLEGTPRKVIDPEAKRVAYNQFARKLVEKGYIVYAPQNPYYGEITFRQINRKANPLKLSLFSVIIRQHQRTLDWLETLPNVDPKRIAFYGLSYGGKTAIRVPAVEKRYCLSICSGDFNEWIGKMVSVDLDRSYMWTREYEMYEFDLGPTFNYAEMAALIAPRPFMVERGHDDGVGTDEMVAYEFAKVRYLYERRLNLKDMAEIEFFNGGHEIRAAGTFAFLDRHLNWR